MVMIPIYLYFQYFIIHVFLYYEENVLIKQFPTTIGTMPQHQVWFKSTYYSIKRNDFSMIFFLTSY